MLWDFFDDIICINLKTRPDRKIYAEKVFKELNIPIKFLVVDKHPKGGIYGCFHSHIQIVNYMNKNNKNNVLVFEDDLIPTASYNIKHIDNAIQFMKNNTLWDLFYLGYFPINYTNLYLTTPSITNNVIKYNPHATHAYCINKRAIPNILNNFNQYIGKINIDVYLANYADLNNYCYVPMLFEQQLCFDSNIEPGNALEYIARKNQCLIQKSKINWRSSILKYYLNLYTWILIYINILLLVFIIIMSLREFANI